ncbi:MAG: hypothetical protein H0T71_08315 [Acidobacteria bacterium]|nr:hypothetical protein [Acidobacteriota bacterium]
MATAATVPGVPEMPGGLRLPRLPLIIGTLAMGLGVTAALYYSRLGLTLSHYDAKAHLVVSRRILDSLTPGWEQIGAVWLPLPHLINMLPVQIDFFYRTGLFAIGVSILSHALAATSIAATVLALTSSRAGAALAATLFATNANILYLQSTPMTEPLLFGLTTLQVFLVTRWVLAGQLRVPVAAGWVTVLACLTRYEAWPITAGCFAASAFAWWRRGHSLRFVLPVYARLALYPLITVLTFVVFSRITVGEWFVSGGFFVPDETLRGQPVAVFTNIVDGVELLAGAWLLRFSLVALSAVTLVALWSAGRSPMLVPLSLFAAAALPLAAYLAGHPFRIRYEIPLVMAGAVSVGLATGLLRRLAPVVALGVLAFVLDESRPFDQSAAMIREAQLDQQTQPRALVTACLQARYRGGAIMMSMGALGHYMHEMSASGFDIRDFLHEGNGPIWDSAFTRGPAPLVEWVMVEEEAEGGDAIVQRHRQLPRLLEDYTKVCSGGNVSLYHRVRNQGS